MPISFRVSLEKYVVVNRCNESRVAARVTIIRGERTITRIPFLPFPMRPFRCVVEHGTWWGGRGVVQKEVDDVFGRLCYARKRSGIHGKSEESRKAWLHHKSNLGRNLGLNEIPMPSRISFSASFGGVRITSITPI